MIAVQSIVDSCESLLRATDSDRYPFDHVFKPAINMAQKWVIALYDKLFEINKVSAMNLSELHNLRVYQTSDKSRVSLPESVWSITGVFPVVDIVPTSTTLDATTESKLHINTAVSKIHKAATNLTLEKWARKEVNPLIPGSPLISNSELIEYAYMGPQKLNQGTAYQPENPREIEISPARNRVFVGIGELDYPAEITAITDNISFPVILEEMITDKTLHFVGILENVEDMPLYEVTSREIDKAIQLLT